MEEAPNYKLSLGGFKGDDKVSVNMKIIKIFEEKDTVCEYFSDSLPRVICGINNNFIINNLQTIDDDNDQYKDRVQIMIHGYEDLNK